MNLLIFNTKHAIIDFVKSTTPYGLRAFVRKAKLRIIYFFENIYNTNPKVYCPIAEREFKSFPKKLTLTNEARPRHRLFWLYIKRETTLLNKKNIVIHIAPQDGLQKNLESFNNLEYIPGDKFLPSYTYSRNVKNIDLLDICYEDNFCDYFLCNRVLEHVDEDIKAMTEMYRVLKKGGAALITVPIDYALTETHESYSSIGDRIKYYTQWNHVRMYSGDIKERLEKIGFKVEMNLYFDEFSKEDQVKFGLLFDTIIIATKPL